jgi:hypothetical protein
MMVSVHETEAQHATVTEDSVAVDLRDGLTVSAPLAWHPGFSMAHPREETTGGWLAVEKPFIGLTLLKT